MKYLLGIIAAVGLTACDQFRDEFFTPGGYVSPLLDDNLYRVVSRKDHFNRYYFVTAIAAPIALYSVADEDSAYDAIRHVKQTFVTLDKFDESLKQCANPTQRLAQNCDFASSAGAKTELTDTSYGFEHNSLTVQRSIARLGSDIRQNIGLSVDISDATDIASSLIKVLSDLSDLVGPMRNIAASYRETMQIVALGTSRQCAVAPSEPNCENLREATAELYVDGKKPSSTIFTESGDPERTIRTLRRLTYSVIESEELGTHGFLDAESKRALAAVIRTACTHSLKFVSASDKKDATKNCNEIFNGINASAAKTASSPVATPTDT